MRNSLILLSFMAILLPASAQAEMSWRKVEHWLGTNSKARGVWSDSTKFNPYLENGTDPHPETFDENWTSGEWVAQRRNGLELVSGYYKADIIRGQHVEEGASVVTVGPNFYRLGGEDKRRIVKSLDEVYGVTAQRQDGTILLRDWYTKRDVGVYTQAGLMLQ